MQKVIANKTLWHYTVFLFAITLHGFPSSLVPRPLIQRVYRSRVILKVICAGVGLGLGPRLLPIQSALQFEVVCT